MLCFMFKGGFNFIIDILDILIFVDLIDIYLKMCLIYVIIRDFKI